MAASAAAAAGSRWVYSKASSPAATAAAIGGTGSCRHLYIKARCSALDPAALARLQQFGPVDNIEVAPFQVAVRSLSIAVRSISNAVHCLSNAGHCLSMNF